ncbi:hypothetical protein RIF29_40121 [Crotalaria pallida]|uniref:Uncharacterized protein n=1 Tax=Crotalaria pallida TaxID=3830 RepID=A0AAN9HRD4_CROPI
MSSEVSEKHAPPSSEEDDLIARSTKKAKTDVIEGKVLDDVMGVEGNGFYATKDNDATECMETQNVEVPSYKEKLMQGGEFHLNSQEIIQMVDQVSTDKLNPEIVGNTIMVEDISATNEESNYGPRMIAARNYRRKKTDSKGRDPKNKENTNMQIAKEPNVGGSRFIALSNEENEIPHVTNEVVKENRNVGPYPNQKIFSNPKPKYVKNPPKGPKKIVTKPTKPSNPSKATVNDSNNGTTQIDSQSQTLTIPLTDEQKQAHLEKKKMEKVILDTMSRYQNEMWRDHKAGKYVENLFGKFIPVVRNGELEFLKRQSSRGKGAGGLDESDVVELELPIVKDDAQNDASVGDGPAAMCL